MVGLAISKKKHEAAYCFCLSAVGRHGEEVAIQKLGGRTSPGK